MLHLPGPRRSTGWTPPAAADRRVRPARPRRPPPRSPKETSLTSFFGRSSNLDATLRVKAWTRDRFGLGAEDVVMVVEVVCGLPGCPPLETVVAFWTDADQRHSFKVFKPLCAVTPEDLPPSWYRGALLEANAEECC